MVCWRDGQLPLTQWPCRIYVSDQLYNYILSPALSWTSMVTVRHFLYKKYYCPCTAKHELLERRPAATDTTAMSYLSIRSGRHRTLQTYINFTFAQDSCNIWPWNRTNWRWRAHCSSYHWSMAIQSAGLQSTVCGYELNTSSGKNRQQILT